MNPLLPVGQRPRCLSCDKELRPRFKDHSPKGQYLWGDELKAWRKVNPKEFSGHYGGYSDDRFCGLNCGYDWAVKHSSPKVGTR